MSNYSLTKDIDEYSKQSIKEINIQFELIKKLQIDKDSKIIDINHLAKKHFSNYCDNFSLFIRDLDISSFGNMNTLRTLEYYRSDQITVRPIPLSSLHNY